jgi:polyhydroxyalkanoate synthase
LIVPPTINKYYVLDLSPGRSIVEHMVQQGFQVFVMSWRNPEAEHGHFDFDIYAGAVLDARATTAEITKHKSVHVMAACSGGLITAGAAGHLAAKRRLSEIASLTLMVCAIDNERAGTTAAFANRETAAMAIAKSARKGYLEGESLASVFAWLRPNDLIWSSAINNYWLGRDLPAFDVLYWNSDTVRLAAGLHRDFVLMSLDNGLAHPDAFTVLDTPVNLRKVKLDTYIVAGSNDHIVPWQNAYRSTQLLGGKSRFVLSTSGHIQALVNPPSPESRSSYRIAEEQPAKVSEWEELAAARKGSWWTDYVNWLSERSGAQKDAPIELGSQTHPVRDDAPGIYVLAA